MHDELEEVMKRTVERGSLTDDGKKFWDGRDQKTASTWTSTNPVPTDWPYTSGVHPMDAKESLGKINKPSAADLEDAWLVLRFACGVGDGEEYEKEDLKRIEKLWAAALKKAKMETWTVEDAAKKFSVADNHRRVKGKPLDNELS